MLIPADRHVDILFHSVSIFKAGSQIVLCPGVTSFRCNQVKSDCLKMIFLEANSEIITAGQAAPALIIILCYCFPIPFNGLCFILGYTIPVLITATNLNLRFRISSLRCIAEDRERLFIFSPSYMAFAASTGAVHHQLFAYHFVSESLMSPSLHGRYIV